MWRTVIDPSSAEEWFVMGISFCLHFVCQFADFLIYLPGYTGKFPWYEKYRINKGAKRHWEDEKEWPGMRKRLAYYLGLNYLVCYPVMIFLSVKVSGIKVRFEDLPTM